MPRRYQHPRDVPKSKRIQNNPYAVKGHKVKPLQGGVIVSKPNPDGTITRILIDEHGNRHIQVDGEEEPPVESAASHPDLYNRVQGLDSRQSAF